MEKKEIQVKKKEVVVDIICDCCGKSCREIQSTVMNKSRIDEGEPSYYFEYMELKANWGFFSNKDGGEWVAHLCEKCVDEKFSDIKFQKNDYLKKIM